MECTRPHQSGMEKKHEKWVTSLLNFLHAINVDVYKGGWNANSLEGMQKPKGEVMEPSDRLDIARRKFEQLGHDAARARLRAEDAERALLKVSKNLTEAEDLLENLWIAFKGQANLPKFLSNVADLGEYLKERRPYLFEEKEEENGKSQGV